MLKKLNTKSGGFTLVEIMIVVAIIALLASIAVPNFLRARKRSQATAILQEIRLIDGAKDQYAIENNKSGIVSPTWTDLKPYVKVGTRLYNQSSTTTTVPDALSNNITLGTIDTPPTISTATRNNFSDVITTAGSFWGSYTP